MDKASSYATAESIPLRHTTRTTGTFAQSASPTSLISEAIAAVAPYKIFSDDLNTPDGFICITYNDGSVSVLPPSQNDYTVTAGSNAIARVSVKGVRTDVSYLDNGVVHTLESQNGQRNQIISTSTTVIRTVTIYATDPDQVFDGATVPYSVANVPDGFFAYATADGSLMQIPAPIATENIYSDSANPIVHIMSRNVSIDIMARRNGADTIIRMVSAASEFFVDPVKDLKIQSMKVYVRAGDMDNDVNRMPVSARLTLDVLPEGLVAIIRADRAMTLYKKGANVMIAGTSDNPIVCVMTKYVALDISAVVKGVTTVISCTAQDSSTFSVSSEFSISSVFISQ